MNFSVSTFQEVGDYFRALPFRVLGLEIKAGIFLVAFGWKTDVVELHFVHARLGHELRQGYVVILHFGIRGIGPDQLAVFAPGLAGAVRLHGQLGVGRYKVLITEDCDPRNGVHVFRVQEADEFRQVGDVVLLAGGEWMIEGNVDDAVAVLDIKHHGVAADFAPATNNAQAAIATGHHAGQVDGAYFEVLGNGYGFLYNRRVQNSGDDQLFARMEEGSLAAVVGLADGIAEF